MRLLKRQFGANFARVFSKSSILMRDLAECRRRGVRIRRVTTTCQAYSIPARKIIGIGVKCSRSYQLTAFAHEMYHSLYGTAPLDFVPAGMSERQFVNLLLEEETDSIVHEMKVVEELLAAKVRLDSETMRYYKRWRRGGRPAIRRMMTTLDNSVTGERYTQYYARLYREALEKQRVA
jgi:hypothetical protein